MNFPYSKYILLLSLLSLLFSCKKNFNNNISTNPIIYIAGSNGTNPVLWINGDSTLLSTSKGYANQVLLSGNDIYVTGIDSQIIWGPGGNYVYWKNDVRNSVGPCGTGYQTAPSMVISGNNIYYWSVSAWKNGSPISLPGQAQSGRITSIFANGTDIYMTGQDSVVDTVNWVYDAVYWKNGHLNVLPQSIQFASCITVSGNDIYVGGTDNVGRGLYLNNGIATLLQTTIIGGTVLYVRSILISGTNVYALANLLVPANGGTSAPVYWKNGVEWDLPLNGATYGYANSIFIYGSDVYVAGNTSQGAVYWKNGVEHILSSSSNASANSIFVK